MRSGLRAFIWTVNHASEVFNLSTQPALGVYRWRFSRGCATKFSQGKTDLQPPDQPKRIWPRQSPRSKEEITPPGSTSIASVSTAPLVKDLFHGQIHLELLDYPELTTKAQVDDVNAIHERIKHLVLQVNSTMVDQTNGLELESIIELAKHGLMALQVDPGFGGQGLTNTQAARAWEAIGLDGATWSLLDAHNSLATRTIQLGGTEEQKCKFLPSLVSGKHIAAFCLHELSSGSDMLSLKTVASPSGDGTFYTLNGHKTWVVNGAIASHFVVFARVGPSSNRSDGDCNTAAFIVERNTPGITCSKRLDTLGLRGANATELALVDVVVPAGNVLDHFGDGLQLAQSVIDRERLDLAASCVGLLRYLISYITEHCLQRHQFGRPIGDYTLVQAKLSSMALDLYAVESAVFFLTGLLDAQPQRNLTLEMAALKVFATEALWTATNNCVRLSGCMGLLKDVPFERHFRDSMGLLIHGGTNELLKLTLAGAGFQHVELSVRTNVEHMQHFTRHPFAALKTVFKYRARRQGKYANTVGAGLKVTEGGASRALKDHLHPNFTGSATQLSILCQRFHSLCEFLLTKHGQGIADEQTALERVANCAIDLFLTPICLGRASRAISIGIHLHDYEVRLADTFAKVAFNRIESALRDLSDLDMDHHRIASELLSHRGYPVWHPLTRVW